MIGGVESITMTLSEGIATWPKTQGEGVAEVTVATNTPAGAMDDSCLPFRIVRKPTLRELVSLFRSADIVHLAGPSLLPLLLGYLLQKTVVVEHHGYQSICPNGLLLYEPDKSVCIGHFMKGRYRQCVLCGSRTIGWKASLRSTVLTFPRRWLCKRVAGNIAVSKHVAQRISLPRTRTIYHGIEDAVPIQSTVTILGGEQLKIGYVGRLVEGKGLTTLLDAAKRLAGFGRSFHVTLIGDGSQRVLLERQVESLGLKDKVTFTGFLVGARLHDVLDPIGVVVLPSECEETAGLAAMEQMIRGGVVVVADIGGLGEVVGDAGIRFTAGDSAALASHLMQLQDNPPLMTRLRSAARRRAVHLFDRDKMILEHLTFYREAMSKALRNQPGIG
jgi:glycosyltransferase involved in cell wall biosynthesis